jgi:hypothetical protein
MALPPSMVDDYALRIKYLLASLLLRLLYQILNGSIRSSVAFSETFRPISGKAGNLSKKALYDQRKKEQPVICRHTSPRIVQADTMPSVV